MKESDLNPLDADACVYFHEEGSKIPSALIQFGYSLEWHKENNTIETKHR